MMNNNNIVSQFSFFGEHSGAATASNPPPSPFVSAAHIPPSPVYKWTSDPHFFDGIEDDEVDTTVTLRPPGTSAAHIPPPPPSNPTPPRWLRLDFFESNSKSINCDLDINLESSSNSVRKSGQSAAGPSIPPVPPKEPTFSCPICMGPLVEEMSTKCGHIFCKACIKASIAAQGKCPTCRTETTAKDIIRVYLPSTRSA